MLYLVHKSKNCVNQDSKPTTSFEGYMQAEECIKVLFPRGGCCLRKFRELHSQGFLPYLKLGRNVLYRPSDVIAALERQLKVKAVQ